MYGSRPSTWNTKLRAQFNSIVEYYRRSRVTEQGTKGVSDVSTRLVVETLCRCCTHKGKQHTWWDNSLQAHSLAIARAIYDLIQDDDYKISTDSIETKKYSLVLFCFVFFFFYTFARRYFCLDSRRLCHRVMTLRSALPSWTTSSQILINGILTRTFLCNLSPSPHPSPLLNRTDTKFI